MSIAVKESYITPESWHIKELDLSMILVLHYANKNNNSTCLKPPTSNSHAVIYSTIKGNTRR